MEALELTLAAVSHSLHNVNREIRTELDQLDAGLLHRRPPAPDTNTIAIVVHHGVNAEMDILRLVARVTASRDRDAEFRITGADFDVSALLDELAAADRLVDELVPGFTLDRLETTIERSGVRVWTGLRWLFHAHAHTTGHLREAQLTAQWLTALK